MTKYKVKRSDIKKAMRFLNERGDDDLRCSLHEAYVKSDLPEIVKVMNRVNNKPNRFYRCEVCSFTIDADWGIVEVIKQYRHNPNNMDIYGLIETTKLTSEEIQEIIDYLKQKEGLN